jgi:hypothetical protein
VSGSRRNRSVRTSPRRSRPKPAETRTLEPERPEPVEFVLLDPDRPIIPTFEELLASARRTAREAFLKAAPFLEIDQPRRAGETDWHEGEEGEIPETVPADESPLDLARRTWLRREKARRDSSVTASAAPSGLAGLMAEVKRREAEWRQSSG